MTTKRRARDLEAGAPRDWYLCHPVKAAAAVGDKLTGEGRWSLRCELCRPERPWTWWLMRPSEGIAVSLHNAGVLACSLCGHNPRTSQTHDPGRLLDGSTPGAHQLALWRGTGCSGCGELAGDYDAQGLGECCAGASQ